MENPTPETIEGLLQAVHDPEIPSVSIVDLGMVGSVEMAGDVLNVSLLPTFVGCPAQRLIEAQVAARLSKALPGYHIGVRFNLTEAWSSTRISEAGRKALRAAGIAPPGRTLDEVACPFCGSANAVLENLFASTSCRSLYYCKQCRNPFEAFKPL